MTFTIDGQLQDPVDLSEVDGEDVAAFSTSTLTQGSHSVTAAYSGDGSFDASTSDPLGQRINAATTTGACPPPGSPATVGDEVTFTAVVATTGTGTPGGTVTYTIDGQAQDPVDLAIVDGEDVATFTTSSLTQGSPLRRCRCSGDDSFDASTPTR